MPISLKIAGGTFTARLWPTLISLVLVTVLLGLSGWQVQRLHWKEALIASIEARRHDVPINLHDLTGHEAELDYRLAITAGVFEHGKTMYLNAISTTGEGGYHVLTPMRLGGNQLLLVDRGWIPYARRQKTDDRDQPGFSQPEGTVLVQGYLRTPPKPGWMVPANNPAANDWYSIKLDEMSAAVGEPPLLPYLLEADATPNAGGFPIGGQTRVELPNNHLGYALTWLALALVAGVIYGVSGWKRDEKSGSG